MPPSSGPRRGPRPPRAPDRPAARVARLTAIALLAAACSHTEPFRSDPAENPVPHDSTPPIRLTLDPGADQYPAWLPDGSGLLYSYELQAQPDRDRCLGLLPPGGGSRRLEQCATGDPTHDSTNALLTAAAGPGRRAAWVDVVGLRTLAGPQGGGIRVGPRGDQRGARLVQALPYFAPGGLRHAMATDLAWLGDSAVVYLGNELLYTSACSSCKVDTVPVGREIILLKVDRTPAALEIIPGTFEATSLALAPDGHLLYFTLAGDSRIWARQLQTGTVSLIHDFGGLGIARDVSVTATALVAVVGGQVTYFSHPQYGPMQVDAGGTLYHLVLGTGQRTPLSPAGQLARHPALSPDGRRVAVEITALLQPAAPDLYLYTVP